MAIHENISASTCTSASVSRLAYLLHSLHDMLGLTDLIPERPAPAPAIGIALEGAATGISDIKVGDMIDGSMELKGVWC